ncbi:oxidoreductase [Idiomarina sp. HP20-50]|uniref:oxidoreductase n=1 Tax=Idiomarina sp. HP20-50 TaxID=3070813 RepID=UPI00294B8047|nr:oxidoreductase [Idiomarina sp. HP20-50]MDV6316969.1 oxidoreductase [Idiomarina sp. HP20-50]
MLENKKIIVFGSSGLIGRAVSKALSDKGALILAADINSTELSGSHYQSIKCDVTSEEDVERIFIDNSPIDGVINCAYPRNKQFGQAMEKVSLESFNENISLQLGSSFNVLKHAANYFSKTNHPVSVVSLSSIYGVVAPRFSIYSGTKMTTPPEYAAVKSGLIHLTKYFARYVNDSNFRVNCISPGGVEDGQPDSFQLAYKNETMGKGMLNAEDLCGAVEFLLSDASKYIQANNLIVDDGFWL